MSIATHVRVQARDAHGNPITDEQGNPVMGVAINPAKPFVRSYWIPGADNFGAVEVVLPATGAPVMVEFVIDDQGHFDWQYLLGVSSNPYTLKFFDVGKNRELQNRPVLSNLIVGSAQRPFQLPENYFFNVGDSQRVLRCELRDVTGSENTVRLALHGRRFYHKDADPDIALRMQRVFGQGERTYSYFLVPQEYDPITGLPPTIPANGKATFTMQSDAGADTELRKFMAFSTGAFSVKIFDRSKNKFLMNDVVEGSSAFGNSEFPFIPADSYLLERQKYLLFYLEDLSGGNNTIYLCAAARRLQLIP